MAIQIAHDQYEKGELEKAKDGFNYVPMLFLSNIILLRSSWAIKLMINAIFGRKRIERRINKFTTIISSQSF